MNNGWMIRAGNGGRYFDDFKDNNCVAVEPRDIWPQLARYLASRLIAHSGRYF